MEGVPAVNGNYKISTKSNKYNLLNQVLLKYERLILDKNKSIIIIIVLMFLALPPIVVQLISVPTFWFKFVYFYYTPIMAFLVAIINLIAIIRIRKQIKVKEILIGLLIILFFQ